MLGFRTFTFVAGVTFAAAAAPAAASQDPNKIAITPTSTNAAIILKAANLRPAPTFKTAYRIGLQIYDPEVQKMRGGPYGGSATIAAQPKLFVDGYLVIDLKPGTYAFRDLSQQDYWALCFHDESLQFTVKPGELLYLGELDVPRHVAQLQILAIMTGKTSTRGEPVHFFDGVSPPAMTPADEAGLAAAAAMAKARMPKTSVAPKAATLSKARFGTGNDLFGLMRICGGYYQKAAKPPAGAKTAK